MKQITFIVENEERMINLGRLIARSSYPNLVIALTGDLGAGKTTLTKGIGLELGIKRIINSPTFTIMKIYDVENKINGILKLYHLDVYRLNNANDDFELAEYFNLDGLSVVEWADIIKDILPSTYWHLTISLLSLNKRQITISCDECLIEAIKGAHYEIIDR